MGEPSGRDIAEVALRADVHEPITLDPWDVWPRGWERDMRYYAVELDELHAPPALAYDLGRLAEKRAGRMVYARALHSSIPSPERCPVANPVRPEIREAHA